MEFSVPSFDGELPIAPVSEVQMTIQPSKMVRRKGLHEIDLDVYQKSNMILICPVYYVFSISELFTRMSMIDISAVSNIEVGQIDYPSGRTLGPRTQADLQFVILDRGSVQIDTDGAEVQLRPGQLSCQWPGFREMYRFDLNGESSHRWIAVSPRDEHAVQKMLSLRQWLPNTGVETPMMRGLFEAIHKGPASLIKGPAELAPDRSWPDVQALLAVAYFTAYADQATTQQRNLEHVLRPQPLQKLWRFIEENYDHPLTLSDLAEATSVTPSYLIRLCRKHNQPTPMQWLWNVRVERGHDLLKYTGLTVAEIAYRVGFSSPYHFSRLFRQRTGVAPTHARSIAWNASEENEIPRGLNSGQSDS